MHLKTLKYFVAIADAGSLTAAASMLSIAQPALTRQLRELEALMETQLLQRGPKGVRLTQAGATLYLSARRMLAEAAQVKLQLQGHAGHQRVVLGASPTLTRVLLPGVFERCYERLANLNLVIQEAFTPQLLAALEHGSCDVAIVTNPPPGRVLAMEPLLAEPFALVTPASFELGTSISLADLAHVPIVMTRFHREIVERALAPLHAGLHIQAEIDSVDTIRELVIQGKRATLMPVSVFLDAPPEQVRLTEVSGAQLHRMLVLATRIDKSQDPSVALICDIVRTEAAALAAQGIFSLRPQALRVCS